MCCRLVWVAWACSAPSVPPLQLAGPPGPTHCPSCARAAPTLLPGASQNSLQVRPAAAAACLRAAEEAGRALGGAGWQGRPSWHDVHNGLRPTQCDLPEPGQGWHPAPALPTFARPSCCLPCNPLARPCYVRSPGRMQLRGSVPSRARLAPPCRPTPCS